MENKAVKSKWEQQREDERQGGGLTAGYGDGGTLVIEKASAAPTDGFQGNTLEFKLSAQVLQDEYVRVHSN